MTTREGRRVQADRRAAAGGGATARDHAGDGPEGQMAGLSRRFPPRAPEADWPATGQRRGHVLARLFAPPFTAGRDDAAVQPADRPDQAGALAGGAARPHLAGPVGGQRRRRRGQPGVAGAGRVMASRHRLGQRRTPGPTSSPSAAGCSR